MTSIILGEPPSPVGRHTAASGISDWVKIFGEDFNGPFWKICIPTWLATVVLFILALFLYHRFRLVLPCNADRTFSRATLTGWAYYPFSVYARSRRHTHVPALNHWGVRNQDARARAKKEEQHRRKWDTQWPYCLVYRTTTIKDYSGWFWDPEGSKTKAYYERKDRSYLKWLPEWTRSRPGRTQPDRDLESGLLLKAHGPYRLKNLIDPHRNPTSLRRHPSNVPESTAMERRRPHSDQPEIGRVLSSRQLPKRAASL